MLSPLAPARSWNRHALPTFVIFFSLLRLAIAANPFTQPFTVAHPLPLGTWTPAYRTACDPGHERFYCSAANMCHFDDQNGAFGCCQDQKHCVPATTCVGFSTTTATCESEAGCLKCHDIFMGNCLTIINPGQRIWGIECNSRGGTMTTSYHMDANIFSWPIAPNFPWVDGSLTTTETVPSTVVPPPTAVPGSSVTLASSPTSSATASSPYDMNDRLGESKTHRARLSTGLIVGITFASIVGIGLLVGLAFHTRKSLANRRENEEIDREPFPGTPDTSIPVSNSSPKKPTRPNSMGYTSPFIRAVNSYSHMSASNPAISRPASSAGTSLIQLTDYTVTENSVPGVLQLPEQWSTLARSVAHAGFFTPPRGPPPANLPTLPPNSPSTALTSPTRANAAPFHPRNRTVTISVPENGRNGDFWETRIAQFITDEQMKEAEKVWGKHESVENLREAAEENAGEIGRT